MKQPGIVMQLRFSLYNKARTCPRPAVGLLKLPKLNWSNVSPFTAIFVAQVVVHLPGRQEDPGSNSPVLKFYDLKIL